jgi:two-component system C4-dicarboxylate transport response regulator DctD
MMSRKISIIEDNNALRSALVDRLKLEGFCAKGFLDGQDFLNQLPQTTSDLIVSDVEMPRVGGLELLERLQSLGVTTPVILMSGSIDQHLPATCIACGAAAFLKKSFQAQTLIDRIDEICRSFTARDQLLNSTHHRSASQR